VYEVPSSGHFFREMVDYPNISQIMEKNIYSMFRTFAAIACISSPHPVHPFQLFLHSFAF
jgi:hypothetical protein